MVSMASVNVIPETSKEKYMNAYTTFNNWRKEQGTNLLSENVFLAYFALLASKMKPSSLWAQYSMLRMTVNINNNTDISNYIKLKAFLKRKSHGYRPRKSKTFTPEEINRFINEAPDSQYLLTKVVLIMGVMGACRREELHKMKLTDIKDLGSAVLVEIPNPKTKIARKFIITGRFYDIFKRYAALRPQKASPSCFFLNYQKGKCTVQKIGINKIGQVGKQIAKYLNLANPELYTGHCFRRSSATILVDSGGDIMTVKKCGGWKSTIVAQQYIGSQTNACTSNMLDRSDDSTFAKQYTDPYVVPDYVDPLQFKVENQIEFHDCMVISPSAIKKEKDVNSLEFVDTNSNNDANIDGRTKLYSDTSQHNSEIRVTNQNEIWERSYVDYCNFGTELNSNYENQERQINGNITSENYQGDVQQFKDGSHESDSSSQMSVEDIEQDDGEFNTDEFSNSCDRTKSLPIEKNDNEPDKNNYRLNADTEKHCSSKVNISTQTEGNAHISHHAETYIDNLLADVYKQTPKTFSEAVNRMFEIDRCIRKLTDYRQSIFSNKIPLGESNSSDCLKETATAQDFHKNIPNENKSNAQTLTLPKKRKQIESEEMHKVKRFITANPVTSNDLEPNVTINNICNETRQFEKEDMQDKNHFQAFPIQDEKILVIKVMEDKLVTGTESGKIIFFNLRNYHSWTVLHVGSAPITSILFIKNESTFMYVGSLDETLKIYNFGDHSIVDNIVLDDSIQCMEDNWGYIFIGCTEGSLLRYSIEKKAIEFRDKFSDNSILVLKATEEGDRRVLLVGSRNVPVCIRDAMTGFYMRTMENIVSSTKDSLILEKSLVYCGSSNENILVYSFHDGKLIQGHKVKDSKGIKCMKIFKNLLFASCYNGKIYVYNIKENVFISEIRGPGEVILTMEIFENQVIVSTMSFKLISLPIPEDILNHEI